MDLWKSRTKRQRAEPAPNRKPQTPAGPRLPEPDGTRSGPSIWRRPVWWAGLLALVLSLYLVPFSCYHGDDYIQIGTLAGVFHRFGSSPWDLFGWLDGTEEHVQQHIGAGPLPWFVAPKARVHFFRPLSSALLTLDHALFGRDIGWYRVQAIIWYVILVGACGAWLNRAVPRRKEWAWHPAAILALLIFTLSDSHWVNVLWTASRWVLPATALPLVGAWAHLRWRQDGWRPGQILGPAGVGLGMLAGEVAFAMLAYILAYEIVVQEPGHNWRARWSARLIYGSLAMLYLVMYHALGYGTSSVAGYVDPLQAPVAFLRELPLKCLAYCGEMFLWTPAVWANAPAMHDACLTAGTGGLLLMLVLLAPTYHVATAEARRTIRWLLLGTLGALLPLLAGTPGGRNLMVPFVGVAGLLGIALFHWWTHIRCQNSLLGWLAVPICLGVGFVHLGLAPYRWFTEPRGFRAASEQLAAQVAQIDYLRPDIADQRTVFLTVQFQQFWMGYFIRHLENMPMPARWWLLSAAGCEHRYQRPSANVLVLETVAGQMMVTQLEIALRGRDHPIQAEETFTLEGLEVRVLAVGDRGPTGVEFTFDRSLDDPSLNFLASRHGQLVRVEPPPVGGQLVLASPF